MEPKVPFACSQVPVLNHTNQVHDLPSYSFNICFNIIIRAIYVSVLKVVSLQVFYRIFKVIKVKLSL
jgi:hypothetical protein